MMLSDNDNMNKAKAKDTEEADQNFYDDVHNRLAAVARR